MILIQVASTVNLSQECNNTNLLMEKSLSQSSVQPKTYVTGKRSTTSKRQHNQSRFTNKLDIWNKRPRTRKNGSRHKVCFMMLFYFES